MCSDESIKWFKSYLLDRNQCTSFKGKVSEKLPIKTGVPQGSILGPLLFIVFINNLPMSITNSNVDIYADDSTATATATTTEEVSVQLNQDATEIKTWSSYNHMAANTSKMKVTLVTNWQKRLSLPADQQKLSIQIGSENLQNVESENILGITINQNLS